MSIHRTLGLLAMAVLAVPVALPAQRDARARLLIEPDGLAALLDSPQLVLLHVGDRAEYDQAHIPGARFVQLADISAPRSNEPGALVLELPEPDVLRRTLEGLGISDDSRIVVYFGNDWVTPATRVVLTLTWAGLGDRVSLLDGGMQAWKAAGHPVTADAPVVDAGHLSPFRTRDVVVKADWVRDRLDRDGFAIIDARAPMFYQGRYEQRDSQRPGHIAGARSIPFTEVVTDALEWKDEAALRSLFREAGVQPSDTVVAYCHIGQQATVVVFAARLIGQPVVLYDGSYTEWGSRPELPIEKPDSGGSVMPVGRTVASPEAGARRGIPAPRLVSPLLNGWTRTSGGTW